MKKATSRLRLWTVQKGFSRARGNDGGNVIPFLNLPSPRPAGCRVPGHGDTQSLIKGRRTTMAKPDGSGRVTRGWGEERTRVDRDRARCTSCCPLLSPVVAAATAAASSCTFPERFSGEEGRGCGRTGRGRRRSARLYSVRLQWHFDWRQKNYGQLSFFIPAPTLSLFPASPPILSFDPPPHRARPYFPVRGRLKLSLSRPLPQWREGRPESRGLDGDDGAEIVPYTGQCESALLLRRRRACVFARVCFHACVRVRECVCV